MLERSDADAGHIDDVARHLRVVSRRVDEHLVAVTARSVLIARSLERIGDNAVDIAEQAVFLVSAELQEFTGASRPKRGRRA